LKELQLVMNPGFNILLILIRCLLTRDCTCEWFWIDWLEFILWCWWIWIGAKEIDFLIFGICEMHMMMICIECCLFCDLETFDLFNFLDSLISWTFKFIEFMKTISTSIPVSLM
jgi:hypothetical protein